MTTKNPNLDFYNDFNILDHKIFIKKNKENYKIEITKEIIIDKLKSIKENERTLFDILGDNIKFKGEEVLLVHVES